MTKNNVWVLKSCYNTKWHIYPRVHASRPQRVLDIYERLSCIHTCFIPVGQQHIQKTDSACSLRQKFSEETALTHLRFAHLKWSCSFSSCARFAWPSACSFAVIASERRSRRFCSRFSSSLASKNTHDWPYLYEYMYGTRCHGLTAVTPRIIFFVLSRAIQKHFMIHTNELTNALSIARVDRVFKLAREISTRSIH